MHRHLYILRTLAMALANVGWLSAHAECSRVINVPMSSTGLSVLVNGDAVSGIYPDLLRVMSDKEKCTFAMTAVPRARLEVLFETGRADVLIPASKTPKRDALGTFVALIQNRALLMSIQSKRPAIKSVQELLDQTSLQVALVRDMVDTLCMEPLEELPWGSSGVYLSNTSLGPTDLAALLDAMERAARSGDVWKSFQRYYSPAVLKSGVRPLP